VPSFAQNVSALELNEVTFLINHTARKTRQGKAEDAVKISNLEIRDWSKVDL
jgi:hypothetical protein